MSSCKSIASIPLPADDCDRLHSIHAALSSLGAVAASFDATMDSLSSTSARQRKRVEELELRTVRLREALRRLDDMVSESSREAKECSSKKEKLQSSHSSSLDGRSRYIKIHCPSTYEEALRGVENTLSDIRTTISTRDTVRSSANDAIRQVLTKDMNSDDGLAIPSDAWLDHASSGLDVERAVEHTNEMRSIPLISGDNNNDVRVSRGESNYQRILKTLALNASNKIDGLDRLHETRNSNKGGGGGDDEQTVYTTTSQTSYMSMTSSGTRMTAGQRRRWHKQQQQQQQQQQMQMMMMKGTSSTMLAPHIEETNVTTSFVAGRQQSQLCSQPYLCEVFHDSYGIGLTPPRGLVDCPGYSSMRTREGGTEFYTPVNHITDLHVFNTARDCYGGAAAVTVTKKDDVSGI